MLMPLLLLGLMLVGCVGQSDTDQRVKASEFSEEGFEAEMKKAGKGQELEDAKKREAEYLSAGQDSKTQDGPTNAGEQGGG